MSSAFSPLLAMAETGPLDELERARADLLRAQVAFGWGPGSDAPTLLFEAAKRLEPLDIDLARQTHLDALCATVYVGPLDSGCDPVEVAQAAVAAVRSGPPRAIDLLLDGLALLITEGYATAAPALRRALSAFDRDDLSAGEGLGWGRLACYVASSLWEHERSSRWPRATSDWLATPARSRCSPTRWLNSSASTCATANLPPPLL
jgi:hypothetical protein